MSYTDAIGTVFCPLCHLKKKTRWYYVCNDYRIIDCDICRVPMVVFTSHKEPAPLVHEAALAKAREMFPLRTPDFTRRSIPSHPHFHMR